MKSKIKNQEKEEEIKLRILDGELEQLKTELDRYIDAIVRHRFLDVCTCGAYFNELYHIGLKDWFKKVNENNMQKSFVREIFGEKKTEEEIKKSNIAYYKRLVSWAKQFMEDANEEQRKKIITDCINQIDLWSEMFNKNSKLDEEIKGKKK